MEFALNVQDVQECVQVYASLLTVSLHIDEFSLDWDGFLKDMLWLLIIGETENCGEWLLQWRLIFTLYIDIYVHVVHEKLVVYCSLLFVALEIGNWALDIDCLNFDLHCLELW